MSNLYIAKLLLLIFFLFIVELPLMSFSTKARNLKGNIYVNSEESLPTPSVVWNVYTSEASNNRENDLQIFSNGTVLLGQRFCNGSIAKTTISSTDLQQMLEFIIEDNDFFAIESEEIKSEIEEIEAQRSTSVNSDTVRVGSEVPYLDTGVTVIQIVADGRKHTVMYDALFAAARDFPEIVTLQQLRAVELKLARFASHLSQELCDE